MRVWCLSLAAREDVSAAYIFGGGRMELRGHSEAQMEMLHSCRRFLRAGAEGGHAETGRMSASSPLRVGTRPPSSAILHPSPSTYPQPRAPPTPWKAFSSLEQIYVQYMLGFSQISRNTAGWLAQEGEMPVIHIWHLCLNT